VRLGPLQLYRSGSGRARIHGRPGRARLAAPLAGRVGACRSGRTRRASNILVVVTRKVIFLRGGISLPPRSNQFESSPGVAPGAARKMFEPCKVRVPRRRVHARLGCGPDTADPRGPSRPAGAAQNQPGGASYPAGWTNSFRGLTRARKCQSRSAPQGVTPGIRSVSRREIQLKSLILAQPERWRRG
jgi:hypothetical protein